MKNTQRGARLPKPADARDEDQLSYGNIDCHFHAGHERTADTNLGDYLEFARMTGRRVLGVTDHFGYYCPGKDKGPRPYEGSLDGLRRFLEDIDATRARFPMLHVLKCPELNAAALDMDLPREALAASDYFLCEPPGVERDELEANTERRLCHARKAAELRSALSRPVLLVHPFRAAVNHRLVKAPIESRTTAWVTTPQSEFTAGELSEFFMFDLCRYAEACADAGLPVEVNGNTDFRVRMINLATPARMLLAAIRLLHDAGVELVPGSDLHGIRSGVGRQGTYVPWTTFEALGLSPEDSPFVQDLLALPGGGTTGLSRPRGEREAREGALSTDSVRVQVELFLVAPHGQGQAKYVRRAGSVGGDPDAAARQLVAPEETAILFLHSTSWRYEEGQVVLTYLAFSESPDWDDGTAGHLSLADVHVHGHGQSSHLHPRPHQLSTDHVLAHGLGHLSWMAHRAESNPCLQRLSAAALDWLRDLVPLPSGRI